jgi:hypothetical protein
MTTAFYKKPNTCHLAIHLLLKAYWSDCEKLMGGKLVKASRGQLVTGRNRLADETGLTPQQIRTALSNLEKSEFLTIESTKAGSVITICKYNEYQKSKSTSNQGINQAPTKHQPSPIINKKKENEKNEIKTFSSDSNEYRLSNLLWNHIKRNNPKAKKPNLESWSKHVDKILRIDGRTVDDTQAVIRWCQKDVFWMTNILSTQKLRKQFDRLYIQMQRDNGALSKDQHSAPPVITQSDADKIFEE